jgi:uncharacterized repeat protein (TIGR01451 family)
VVGRCGVLKKQLGKLATAARSGARAATIAAALTIFPFSVEAGNFAINWGTAPYVWTPNSLGPNTYTLTDQYGFQVQVRFTVTRTNGASAGPFPDDLLTDGGGNTFGTQVSIWQVWNPNLTGGSIGGSTNVGTMAILDGATPVPVDNLSFRVSDIDAVDNNTNPPTNDRCDHLTFTSNAGNPTITAVTGTPTFRIGPGAGSGSSPALAANQVQCIFNTSTAVTSPTSNGDNNGTAQLVFPNGTSTATVNYDESIHNVYNNFSFNAAARGVGIWAASSFVVNNTITLDKQTTATGFAAVGNVIPYTYVVTNNGPLPLRSTQNVIIQDNKIPTVTCPAIPAAGIPSGGTLTCTGSYTVVAADVTANLVTNVATAGVGTGAQPFAARLQSNSDTVTVRRFATLTLVKTITNDNGGTATTAAFTLSAAGPTNISGTSGNAAVTNAAVQPGTYSLSETNVAGYTASAWTCTAGTLTGSSLVLASGQNATCTINNNDVAPRLTLVKTVTNDNGGTATPTSVTLSASGPTTISGVSGAPAVTNAAVNAGTYTLAETALANYTPGAWSCTSGTLTGSSLVLTVGQTATCTINNDDIAPRLTLVKTVTNDNGGTATTANFTLSATGPTSISGVSGAAAVTNAIISAGTYALSETSVAGYAAGLWSCTAGTLTGSNLSIGIGQSATCTINNNDVGPVLTLVKTLTNDNGGTATLASFTLSATGPVTISGTSGSGAVTNATVSAGTYALSETIVAGYAASAWSCTTGTLAGSNLTLALGQTATCTISNDDVAPRLTLVKTVTNDDGGTATTAAFTLAATGPTNISGVSGSGTVTNAAVNAGTYALSETSVSGYAASAWSCTAGTLTGSSFALSIGQTATCTVNNNDIAPVLTLVKTVTDTSGGPSTVGSFTLTATGPVTISGLTGAAAVTNASVSAGTYALSESGPSGYTAGNWSCTAGTLTGTSLALSPGQTSTCTINNIKLPTLTLQKISNGGTGDFGFAGTNGVTAQTITTTTAGGTFTGALMTLTAATTATDITETMPSSFWEIQAAACTGMGTGGTATLSGSVLTLDAAATAPGRNIVCTFTNRRRPTVSVQKITTGAFGGPFSFTDVNLTGAVADITTTATNTATPAVPTGLIATITGTAVSLTETSPLTFITAGVTCSDANSAVSGNTNPVATSANGSVTIPATAVRVGADINCLFTNAQALPALAVTKTGSVATVAAAGTTITYTIAVNNSGNTTLNTIGVADPLGTVVCPSSGAATVTTLAAGATENCTLNYTVPQSVFDTNGGGDGDIDNSATASATYNAAPVSAGDSETVGLVISPSLTVEKIPNSVVPRNEGDSISYIYRVTNSGNVTMTNVTISDAHIGYGTDPVPSNETLISLPGNSTDAAVNGSWDSLAPGDVVEFTSTYTVVQADIDNLQ